MSQQDLFADQPAPGWRPDPEAVRNRLRHIIGQLRAADTMPWRPGRHDLNQMAVEEAGRWLPAEEAAEWREAFRAELTRLGVDPDASPYAAWAPPADAAE